MRIWGKLIAAAVLPLVLSSCLWGPGRFTSDLALRKNGTFVLDYRGEIMLQMPDDKSSSSKPWADSMATCYADGRVETNIEALPVTIEVQQDPEEQSDETRDCTAAELAGLKAEYAKKAAEKAAEKSKENEEMAKLFGLPGSDDASNRRFAANLMKQKGWRSVSYKGKGLFDVDYHFEGRLDQDFAFPLMPDSDLMIPFVMLRPRTDGSVRVSAPAFTGQTGPFGARAKAMGLPDKSGEGPVSRAEGRFTITTDGEILTNNSEEGPTAAPGGRRLVWDVGPGSSTVPEMLVRL